MSDSESENVLSKIWRDSFVDHLKRIFDDMALGVSITPAALAYVEEILLDVLESIWTAPNLSQEVETRVRKTNEYKNRYDVALRHKNKKLRELSISKIQNIFKTKLGRRVEQHVAQGTCTVLENIAAEWFYMTADYVKLYTKGLESGGSLVEITKEDLSVVYSDWYSNTTSEEEIYDNVPMRCESYDQLVRILIAQENAYIRELYLLTLVFRGRFASLNVKQEDCEIIFGPLTSVLETTVKLLSLLEDAEEMMLETRESMIGRCFYEMAENFEFYSIKDYATAVLDSPGRLARLHKIVNQKNFASQIEQQIPMFRLASKYALPLLQLRPVVHMMWYFEVIKELMRLSHSEQQRFDLEQTESILQPLQKILRPMYYRHCVQNYSKQLLNISCRPSSTRDAVLEKVDEMQKKIDGFDFKEASKVADCGEFLNDGSLLITLTGTKLQKKLDTMTMKSKNNDRHVFLFDKLLVVCKTSRRAPSSSSFEFKFKECIPIHRLDISDLEDSEDFQNSFELHVRDGPTMICVASSAKDKRQWMAGFVLLLARGGLERVLDSCLKEREKQHALILPDPGKYRFAEPDSESNIVFEDYCSSEGTPVIKGATVLKLVERLTYHSYIDTKFLKTLLTTYRSFCSPIEFLLLLRERFHIPEPDELSLRSGLEAESLSEETELELKEARKQFKNKYVKPIQLRVINVIRHWVEHHWYDFAHDEDLYAELGVFLDEINCNAHLAKWVFSIKSNIERKKVEKTEKPIERAQFELDPPPPEVHLAPAEADYDIMTIHPIEFARQYTLMEFDLYRSVRPIELVDVAWTKADKHKRSPQLLQLINSSTKLTYWLARCILDTGNVDERVAVVNRILEIMCVFEQDLYNFTGFLEIFYMFKMSSVHRLKHTWERIDPALDKRLKSFDLNYRDPHHKFLTARLKSINPPCVPFFGRYLTSLVFLNEATKMSLDPMGNHQRNSSTSDDGLADDAASAVDHNDHSEISDDDELDSATYAGRPSGPDAGHRHHSVSTRQPIIWFSKRRKIADVIGEIQMYQNTPYNLKRDEGIQQFFERIISEDNPNIDNYLWERSILIEPKDCGKDPPFIAPKRAYALRSPGIKPSRASAHPTRHQRPSTTTVLPPPPDSAPLVPANDRGAHAHAGHNSVMAIVELGAPAGASRHIEDIPPSSRFHSLPGGSDPANPHKQAFGRAQPHYGQSHSHSTAPLTPPRGSQGHFRHSSHSPGFAAAEQGGQPSHHPQLPYPAAGHHTSGTRSSELPLPASHHHHNGSYDGSPSLSSSISPPFTAMGAHQQFVHVRQSPGAPPIPPRIAAGSRPASAAPALLKGPSLSVTGDGDSNCSHQNLSSSTFNVLPLSPRRNHLQGNGGFGGSANSPPLPPKPLHYQTSGGTALLRSPSTPRSPHCSASHHHHHHRRHQRNCSHQNNVNKFDFSQSAVDALSASSSSTGYGTAGSSTAPTSPLAAGLGNGCFPQRSSLPQQLVPPGKQLSEHLSPLLSASDSSPAYGDLAGSCPHSLSPSWAHHSPCLALAGQGCPSGCCRSPVTGTDSSCSSLSESEVLAGVGYNSNLDNKSVNISTDLNPNGVTKNGASGAGGISTTDDAESALRGDSCEENDEDADSAYSTFVHAQHRHRRNRWAAADHRYAVPPLSPPDAGGMVPSATFPSTSQPPPIPPRSATCSPALPPRIIPRPCSTGPPQTVNTTLPHSSSSNLSRKSLPPALNLSSTSSSYLLPQQDVDLSAQASNDPAASNGYAGGDNISENTYDNNSFLSSAANETTYGNGRNFRKGFNSISARNSIADPDHDEVDLDRLCAAVATADLDSPGSVGIGASFDICQLLMRGGSQNSHDSSLQPKGSTVSSTHHASHGHQGVPAGGPHLHHQSSVTSAGSSGRFSMLDEMGDEADDRRSSSTTLTPSVVSEDDCGGKFSSSADESGAPTSTVSGYVIPGVRAGGGRVRTSCDLSDISLTADGVSRAWGGPSFDSLKPPPRPSPSAGILVSTLPRLHNGSLSKTNNNGSTTGLGMDDDGEGQPPPIPPRPPRLPPRRTMEHVEPPPLPPKTAQRYV